ncbi:TetR-like C-terminal domain-containing protein [Corynebacterium sp. 13CS0277]|uniref:TetR-like C-terminal domain-containing protein n=1 Tax=Corynebacterium sp. 13CS0277 TaxID=2071994 RepID=UPI001304BC28|nr:TetR-like C-terminal domain-containing protein [Corynebacterium sp. 13CS0277]
MAYHHGDLKQTLLTLAAEALAAGEPLSLRKLAAAAGVSPAATYRHFRDKHALESALAAQGFAALDGQLADLDIHTPGDLVRVAHTYLDFALAHPATFHLMFTTDCDPTSPDRVAAVDSITTTCLDLVAAAGIAPADAPAAMSAIWSFAHGITTLTLEGKLPSTAPADAHRTIDQAWAAWAAMLNTHPA